ncbi:MAG: hypothetical protein K6A90_14725 [Lachnospiraceae bacterium]|nr:hypothetical protein [Lachnospiraceae bacterium]
MQRGLNGDQEYYVCRAAINHAGNYTVNATISGNTNSDHWMYIDGKNGQKYVAGDRINLDVDCRDAEDDESIVVAIPKMFFTENTTNFRDTVVKVIRNPGTKCQRSEFLTENGTLPCWKYEFSAVSKKVTVDKWTITDKNVAGNETSFVSGDEQWNENMGCWAEVVSPLSGNRAIDTTITGALNCKHLDWFLVLDHELENDGDDFGNCCRELTENDHILIDVVNSVDKAWVQVGMPLENFRSGATVDDILRIVEIKKEPGVEYEAGIDDDGGDNYFYINFVKTRAQEKIDLAKSEREKDTDSKTQRTQVFGDTIPVTGLKEKKKWAFSVTGLKEKKGEQRLTVNEGIKFLAEDLKGLDMSKVTISFNNADGTTTAGRKKDVKKHLKINKKGQVSVKKEKKYASYTLNIPVGECVLHLTVVNIDFDKKALKKKYISALTGEGSTVSVNLFQMAGKEVKEESEFLSADWKIDGKTDVKTTNRDGAETSKKGLKAYLSEDYRTIIIFNPGDVKKGSVKVTATINGKKYSATVKVKIK